METETKSKFGPGRCQICGKPIVASTGDIGGTCKGHIGHIQEFAASAAAVPEGYIGMSKVCRAYEAAGFTTRQIVDACGKDACTAPVLDPIFRPVYVGKRKFLNPLVMTKGMELLRAALSVEVPKAEKPKNTDKTVAKTAQALKAHAVVKADAK